MALNSARGVEVWGEDAFYLLDESGAEQVGLVMHSPGSDFSEVDASYWRIIHLEDNTSPAQSAEVHVIAASVEIYQDGFLAAFPFQYKSRKLRFHPAYKKMLKDGEHLPEFFTQFENMLPKISGYAVSGDYMNVTDASGHQLMQLQRIRTDGLEYRHWHIASYSRAGVLEPTKTSFQHLRFEHGRTEGSAGCGGLFGSYKLAGNALSISTGSILAGWCSAEAEKENREVLEALNGVLQIKRDGDRMLLQDNRGTTRAILTRIWQNL